MMMEGIPQMDTMLTPMPPTSPLQRHLQFSPFQQSQANISNQQQQSMMSPGFSGHCYSQAFPGGLPPSAPQSPPTQPSFQMQNQFMKMTEPSFELVDRMMERFCAEENMLPSLIDKMRIAPDSGVTLSGIFDVDYPNPLEQPVQVHVNQLKIINKVPLPAEIIEQVGTVNQNTFMGLFPDISRAWLAIDSDIYIWNFETGGDLGYFDGMNNVICSVGLVKPKPNVFLDSVSHLLVLTSSTEISIVGVVIAPSNVSGDLDEIQLSPNIIYTLPTDGVPINTIKGTESGRIFLGGTDGCLYEIVYQKQPSLSWMGKRAKKINHSRSSLSYIVPAFIAGMMSSTEAIVDIVTDDSRHILYTLSDQGTIEAYDLGADGTSSPSKVSTVRQSTIESFTKLLVARLQETGQCPPNALGGRLLNVVGLIPLTEVDSPHLGVVGVTADGVRLYFSTGSPPPHRPSTLRLLHIRYPPSALDLPTALSQTIASPSISTQPPGTPTNTSFGHNSEMLTSWFHKSGTFLFATTNMSTAEDKLWCLSPDYNPMRPTLTEDIQYHCLSAAATLIGEYRSNRKQFDPYCGHIFQYQQRIRPNRFVILTPQGTEIYEKLRPVDILVQILIERNGPDCEEVKQYFSELGYDQACAEALIIACSYKQPNQARLVEWATRAFFLYGGDPKEMMNFQPRNIPRSFKPVGISTPTRDSKLNSLSSPLSPVSPALPTRAPIDNFAFQFSPKHNALYLYLLRILRPVWSEKCLSPLLVNENKVLYTSSVKGSGVCRLTSKLIELKNFLDQNAACNEITSYMPQMDNLDRSIQSADLTFRVQEKNSLDALKTFVNHAAQVFGLWKILCQHQIHLVINELQPEERNALLMSTYRDLVLCGKDLWSSLINTVINMFLSESTAVDPLSSKLREVCPALYKPEDATCTKVNEILMRVRAVTDSDDKLRLLRTAIELCKEVLPHMNHSSVCKQLVQHEYYDGVIELCCDAANKVDPQNLAASFVAKNQRPDDQAGSKAYLSRCNAYKDLAAMLDELFIKCQMGNTSISFDGSSPNQKVLEKVISKCVGLEDEAAHMVVYDWLITRNLQGSVVKFGQPSLERYLARYPPDSALRDLLWQYYEKSGQHAKAAQILYQLATSKGESINLKQRELYLGKAVMCMRNDRIGCAPNLGIFLNELDDLVLVARIQKQVLDEISGMVSTRSTAEEAIKKLDFNLMSLNELFNDYAEPYELWECKLSIFDCAGPVDNEIITSTWDKIIEEERTKCTSSSPDEQMKVVLSKVKSLGLQFSIHSSCFPVEYLVWKLELLSCRLNVNKSYVHTTMISVHVPVSVLRDIYERLLNANDRCWINEQNEFHLIQVIASFADTFTNNTSIAPPNEKTTLAVQFQDLITGCLSILYGKAGANQLISYLKTIQTNLNRIANF